MNYTRAVALLAAASRTNLLARLTAPMTPPSHPNNCQQAPNPPNILDGSSNLSDSSNARTHSFSAVHTMHTASVSLHLSRTTQSLGNHSPLARRIGRTSSTNVMILQSCKCSVGAARVGSVTTLIGTVVAEQLQ
jgi:hypothetical protein